MPLSLALVARVQEVAGEVAYCGRDTIAAALLAFAEEVLADSEEQLKRLREAHVILQDAYVKLIDENSVLNDELVAIKAGY